MGTENAEDESELEREWERREGEGKEHMYAVGVSGIAGPISRARGIGRRPAMVSNVQYQTCIGFPFVGYLCVFFYLFMFQLC